MAFNRYIPSSQGMTELATGAEMHKFMSEVGAHWAEELRAAAPYDSTDEVHYRDNITHSEDTGRMRGIPPRVSTRIEAHVPYAATLEWGNSRMKNPPRPLTKLLDRLQAADPKGRYGPHPVGRLAR